MIKAIAQLSGNFATASARCGLDTRITWWRGNWWRLVPPAVPFASARAGES